jgi:hypothetical protein
MVTPADNVTARATITTAAVCEIEDFPVARRSVRVDRGISSGNPWLQQRVGGALALRPVMKLSTIEHDLLSNISGGQQANQSASMPRSEARTWLRACALSAFREGRKVEAASQGAMAGGNDPTPADGDYASAIAACNVGVGKLVR